MPILGAFIVPHAPVLIPEIGKEKSVALQATMDAYQKIASEIAALKPETIVFITPHAECYSDYFQISDGEVEMGSFADYGAPNINFRLFYDRQFVSALGRMAKEDSFSAGADGDEEIYLDRGTMVPLYYINRQYPSFKAVRVAVSGLPLSSHYRFGQLIQDTAEKLGRRIVIVASGNLSHALNKDINEPSSPGPIYDKNVVKTLSSSDFGSLISWDRESLARAEECGHRSFTVMAGALDRLSVTSRKYSYEAGTGVGYLAMGYLVKGVDASRAFLELYRSRQSFAVSRERRSMDDFAKLAYSAIEQVVKTGKTLSFAPSKYPAPFAEKKAGVFVTIKKDGEIRGCMGSVKPLKKNLGLEIINAATGAALLDKRFSKITEDELPLLSISVDVLTAPIPILSLDDLNPKIYGVYVTYGEKKGVLLPGLPGIRNAEEQLAVALAKAGIEEDENFRMARFAVTHHV